MNAKNAIDPASKRAALVTGAARGLGRAIAHRLGALGHPVLLVDVDPAVVRTAAELHDAHGIDARGIQLDISDETEVAKLASLAGEHWTRLAILVNNAGISPKHEGRKRPVESMPLAEWRRVLDVNLTGAFLMSRACIPMLGSRGWGRIVMITSQAARTRTIVPGAHYQSSKAGLTALARVLAAELADRGVTVNCVAPGRIESEMTGAIDPATNAQIAATIPAGRMGRPDEVAATVAFLASDAAGYLTGASLDVNGGSFMP